MAFNLQDMNAFNQSFNNSFNSVDNLLTNKARRKLLGAQAQAIGPNTESRNELRDAEAEEMRAKAKHWLNPRAGIAGEFQVVPDRNGNLVRINKLTGEASPILQDGKPVGAQMKQGVTVTTDANGRPIVSVGGSGLGSLSRTGGTTVLPDGRTMTIPGSSSKSKLFNMLSANNQVTSQLKDILDNADKYPYFGKGYWLKGLDKYAPRFGADNMVYGGGTPEQRLSANSSIVTKVKLAADKIVKTLGLNSTNENVRLALSLVEPKPGQSKDAYKAQLITMTNDLINLARQSQEQGGGIVSSDIPSPITLSDLNGTKGDSSAQLNNYLMKGLQ